MSTGLLLVLLCCVFGYRGCCGFFSSTPLPVSLFCNGRKVLPGRSTSLLLAGKYDLPSDMDGFMALQNYPPPEFSRPFSLCQLGSHRR